MPLPLRSRWSRPAPVSCLLVPIASNVAFAPRSGSHDLHVDVLGLQISEAQAITGLSREGDDRSDAPPRRLRTEPMANCAARLVLNVFEPGPNAAIGHRPAVTLGADDLSIDITMR